jgi:hypothetical protein
MVLLAVIRMGSRGVVSRNESFWIFSVFRERLGRAQDQRIYGKRKNKPIQIILFGSVEWYKKIKLKYNEKKR